MFESDPVTAKQHFFIRFIFGIIERIADDRIVEMGEMDPDLMRSSGFKRDFQETETNEFLDDAIVGDGFVAAFHDLSFDRVLIRFADGKVDRSGFIG